MDLYSTQLTRIVELAIATHVPFAKPSPYAKRRWTQSLTDLRKLYTILRNRFHRYRNQNAPNLSWAAKLLYFKELKNQKTALADFLEDVENIWSSAKFLQDHTLRLSFLPISRIKIEPTTMATTNAEIGTTLLENFFPPLMPHPPPSQSESTHSANSAARIFTPPIQKKTYEQLFSRLPRLKRQVKTTFQH